MRIQPIASESLGVRSMCVFVETKDCRLLLDPSAALGPKRYKLPPADLEIQTLKNIKEEIRKKADKSDIFSISHYHYDHYDPSEEFYQGKTVFAKDIQKDINLSQRKRGKEFQNRIEQTCDIIPSDDGAFISGDTTITFSPPFFHGPSNIRLGFVVMVTIDDTTQRVLHASDVQGPVTEQARDYIISQRPDILIMDGPPTFFLGWRFSYKNLARASNNLIEIIEKTQCKVLLDHHLLRDISYRSHFPDPYTLYPSSIQTFAEFLGTKNKALEAYRKQLWDDQQTD
ncbi:MAG: MBL fold metallo-hydrolase [Candidatus Thermoplasmatota archaeon]|nr:MBL fold metallo-hydrolase [Candidatus Thermoplasmatota archaeon]